MTIRPIPALRHPGTERQGTERQGLIAGMVEHLRDPMRSSSYALILGTALTSGLGLLFWILAARWLPAATVGIGAALVSAMALLANLSTLGLRNGLVRFLPEAGGSTRRLIATAYLMCSGATLVTAGVFLLGLPLWAPKLGFLRSTPLASVLFAVAVAVWVIFVLQDNVLLALRRTVWVPVVNGICSVAKIALLPVLAFSTVWAIFTATVLPAAAAVLLVTVLVLRRPTGKPAPAVPISIRRLVRFAAVDHLAALLWLGTADLLTLVILQEVGPEASAYYFIANTIGYSLYLVSSNVGSALVAEGARSGDRTVILARQAMINAARLVIPFALLGCLLAPVVLGLLGPDYAANGTHLLQLILLSAIPQIVVAVAMSTARLRHDLRTIIAVYAAQAVGMLGGSWLLLKLWGLTGVGISIVMTATGLAIVLVITGRTGLWSDGGDRAGALGILRRLGSLRRRHRSQQDLALRLAPALDALAVDLQPGPAARPLTSDCDALIVTWPDRPELVKIATSAAASAGLDRHADMLDWLHSHPGLGPFADRLPRVLRRGAADGDRVLLETRLPGHPVPHRSLEPAVTAVALSAIAELHTATARRLRIDTTITAAWVNEPLEVLRRLSSLAGQQRALDQLADTLRDALLDRDLVVAAIHGDFWPGNVLITDGPAGSEISGIVDWENGRRLGLPDTDLAHWWLSTQPTELGYAVRQVLTSPSVATADAPVTWTNSELGLEPVLLLTWLGHVSAGLTRATRHPLGRLWVARNVQPVVRLFGRRPTGKASIR